MKITIETIQHEEQRYETCGDWQFDDAGDLYVKVSDMGNDDYAFLVGIHETVEAWLCRKAGVNEEDVTAFDISFEDEQYLGEPGDSPRAPYRKQHFIATNIERQLADVLDIDWQEYGTSIDNL